MNRLLSFRKESSSPKYPLVALCSPNRSANSRVRDTATCFATPADARSKNTPRETRRVLWKCLHTQQENATATPGSAPVKYCAAKALVFSAATKPANGMQRQNQPTASPGCIARKSIFLSSPHTKTIQAIISASKNKPAGNKSEKTFISK